jgi:hypothetical protein
MESNGLQVTILEYFSWQLNFIICLLLQFWINLGHSVSLSRTVQYQSRKPCPTVCYPHPVCPPCQHPVEDEAESNADDDAAVGRNFSSRGFRMRQPIKTTRYILLPWTCWSFPRLKCLNASYYVYYNRFLDRYLDAMNWKLILVSFRFLLAQKMANGLYWFMIDLARRE